MSLHLQRELPSSPELRGRSGKPSIKISRVLSAESSTEDLTNLSNDNINNERTNNFDLNDSNNSDTTPISSNQFRKRKHDEKRTLLLSSSETIGVQKSTSNYYNFFLSLLRSNVPFMLLLLARVWLCLTVCPYGNIVDNREHFACGIHLYLSISMSCCLLLNLRRFTSKWKYFIAIMQWIHTVYVIANSSDMSLITLAVSDLFLSNYVLTLITVLLIYFV